MEISEHQSKTLLIACVSDAKNLDEFLCELSGGTSKVGTQEGRIAVAMAFGYADSRFLVHLKETVGMPLSLSAIECKKHNLKIDFAGLRYELEKIGKKPETIESELAEVKHFYQQEPKGA